MDLIPQFELIKQAAKAYGIVQIEAKGYEADDVIATLSQRALEQGMAINILSGDKDLMQLITNLTTGTNNGAFIHMVDPLSMTKVTHDTVLEKWGVPAHQLGNILALACSEQRRLPLSILGDYQTVH
jgi:DNA polymerase-1